MEKIVSVILLVLAGFTNLQAQNTVPYLEIPTPTAIWINWKISSGTESKVLYGTSAEPADQWTYETGASGTLKFVGLAKGYYYAQYLLTDGIQQ